MRTDTAKQRLYEFEIVCRNTGTGEVFSRYFLSEFLAKKFLQMCRFSKRVKVMGITDLYNRGSDLYEGERA